jgi:hypothetical protein
MVIRGLRAVSDFEYEFQMAGMLPGSTPRWSVREAVRQASSEPRADEMRDVAAKGANFLDKTRPRQAAPPPSGRTRLGLNRQRGAPPLRRRIVKVGHCDQHARAAMRTN